MLIVYYSHKDVKSTVMVHSLAMDVISRVDLKYYNYGDV